MDARLQLDRRLWDFALKHGWRSQEHLTVALAITDHARAHGIPASEAEMAASLDLRQPSTNTTVDALLRRHGIPPATESEKTLPKGSSSAFATEINKSRLKEPGSACGHYETS